MTTAAKRALCCLLLCWFSVLCKMPLASAQSTVPSATTSTEGKGAHDFDWDIGIWKVHQRRLLHPLSGSTTWVEYDGTDTIRKLWDGANWGIVESDGPAGHLEIYTLRIYDTGAHQGLSTSPQGPVVRLAHPS